MPLYDVKCPSCGAAWEALAKWDADIPCACGATAERQISVPVVRPDLEPYYDDGLGVRVESRHHRREAMKRLSLVENDKPVVPHGAKGTMFSLPGKTTTAAKPSGAYAKGGRWL